MKKNCLAILISICLCTASYTQNIYESVEESNYPRVEELIKSGTNVNKPDKKGQFPLWIATWKNDTSMVKLLLANGANANQRFKKEKVTCWKKG